MTLGGVIFPFFVNEIMQSVGFAGTLRYTALFMGIIFIIACFLLTARLPRKKWDRDSKWVDFALFKDKSFALYTLGAYLVMLVPAYLQQCQKLTYLRWGLWAPFDYLSLMAAKTAGFSPDLALYLIAIMK